jgi:hypothetical protein
MQAPNKTENLSNNTPSRQAIARDGAVLPLVLGRGRVAAQWVTPVLHWTYRNTSRSSYAFFSCFAELCLGPVDEVIQIYVNGKPYHGIYADRADYPSADYVESVLAKETPETFRVYWGLETQSGLSTYVQSLIKVATHSEYGKAHPNYLGRCVIGVQDMEAGQALSGQTPQLPNVEVEVYRRSPTAYSFGGIAWGTHPVGVVKDILTDPRGGLGLPSSLFDSTHWTDAMQRMMDDGASGKTGIDLFISPVLGDQREAGQAIADTLSYFDGFLRQRNGKIEIDWQPNDGTTTSSTGLRELSHHDMTREPQLDAQGIENMVTQVAVTGLDYAADVPLTETTESAQVPYAREIIGEPRTQKIDRPWFVNRDQLRGYAQSVASARSSPAISGSIAVRRESATHPDGITPLIPGDRFNLDYQPRTLDIVCRITERSESDDKAEVTLKFTSERGASPEPYVPPIDPRAEIAPPAPATPTRFSVAQLPPDLTPDDSNYVAALVERPATNCAAFETQFAPTNSWPGQVIDEANTRWAVAAVLSGSLTSSTADVTVTVGTVGAEFTRFESQSALEQSDDTLLMHDNGEWFSVGTITALGGGSYSLALKRARLGSLPRTHSSSAVVMLILRADLIRLYHSSFDSTDIAGVFDTTTATKWFKVRSFNSVGYSSTSSAISLVMLDPTPSAPTGLVGIAGTGKMVQLTWDAVTTALVNEYQVTRATGPAFSDEALLAEVSDPAYWDVDVTGGTTYRYRVRAVTVNETFSPYSSTVDVTANTVGGGIDTTPAGNPSAPTLNTSGTYQATDGSTRSYLTINVPAMPTLGVVLMLLYRRNGGTGWLVADQRSTGGSTTRIDDLSPGVSYEVAAQAFSAYGYGSSIVTATGSPFTAPSDTSGPAAPTGLAAVTGTGKSVSLDWNDNTEADFSEYGIYRNTVNNSSTATKIAETRASRFVDVEVTLGTVYYYWVSAYDRSENESSKSSVASATPSTVAASSTDATAPGTPSAASLSSSGTYLSGDGTVFAYLDISVPALPSLAKYQNLLYKKTSGGGDWLIAAQLTNTGTQTVRIDDLIPGIVYDIAVIAFTAFAVPSAITSATSSPFTAPNKSAGPSAPSSGSVNSRAATILGWSTSSVYFGARAEWVAPADKDHSYYEVKCTSTNSDSAVDYVWFPSNGTSSLCTTLNTFFDYYRTTPAVGYVRVRSVNTSGVAGSWLYCGELSAVTRVVGGAAALKGVGTTSSDVAAGDDSRITGAAQKSSNLSDLSSASTARSNLGLGSMATQNSGSVSISGGTVDSITSNGIIYSGVTHSGPSRFAFGYDGTNWGIWIDGNLKYVTPTNI